MAEAGLRFASPALQAAGLGLSPDPRSTFEPQLAAIGPDQLAPNAADAALIGQPAPPTSQFSSPGTLLPPSSSPRLQRERELRQQREAAAAAPNILYSPSLGRFSVGGVEFGREDYDIALQSQQYLDQPNQPTTPAADWQRIDPAFYQQYISSISEARGFFGTLAAGAQSTGEGLVGGVGRGLQMLGYEGTGQALVNVGEAIGLSPAEEARSAAISQNQGLLGQVGTAIVQSAPTLGVSIGAGLAGAAVAGPVGALAGVALSILPMELQSSWEAAEQNGLDPTDPNVQSDILMSTLFKTGAQTAAPAVITRGFSPALRRVVDQVTTRTLGQRIARGVGAGALEGSAEALAQITDYVVFDPELRAELNEADVAALAPLVAKRHSQEILVAFLAGAGLAGPLGALGNPEAEAAKPAPTPPRREVKSGEQTDMLSGAPLEPQATPSGPVQGPMLEDFMQGPRIEDFMQGPRIEDFQQGPLQVPFMGPPAPPPAPPGPVQGPMLEDFMQGPRIEDFQQGPRIEDFQQGPLQVPFMGPPAPLPAPAAPAPAAPAAPPLLLTPEQQVNIQETRAAKRQAAVAEQNRLIDEAQAAARREHDLLRQRNADIAAREAQMADAASQARVNRAATQRDLARAARRERADVAAYDADQRVAADLAARGTPATQLTYGNLMKAERRVAEAERAYQAARASQDPVRMRQTGAELTAAQEALTRLRARNESELMSAPVAAAPPLLLTPKQRVAPSAPKSDVVSATPRPETPTTPPTPPTPAVAEVDYTVQTKDIGVVTVRIIRYADGEVRVLLTDGRGDRRYSAGFARGKSDEDILRYALGLVGYIGITPAAPAPAPAPASVPKSDVASETTVGPEGLTLLHGGKPGLTRDSVQIVRPAGTTRQGKKGRVYGGLYTTTQDAEAEARGYAGEDGVLYDIRIAPGTRVARRSGDITRLSKATIDQYVADGYGVVVGTDPRGRTEHVVVDKAAIESVTPRPETPTTPPAGGGRTGAPKGGKLAKEAAAKGARQKKAAAKLKGETGAVQEPSAAGVDESQQAEDGQAVGEGDTQGQEAAGAREAQVQDAEVVQRQMALPPEQKTALLAELDTDTDGLIDMMVDDPAGVAAAIDRVEARARAPAPTPAPEPVIARDDTAPRDMPATEAWDKYVAKFLPVEFGLKNLGALQSRWAAEVKMGRGNYDAARKILEDSPTYSVLEAKELYTTSADPQVRYDALSVMLETAFTGDPTGQTSALLGNKSTIKYAQDFLRKLRWTDADLRALLEFATLDSTVEARTAEKPNAQARALNALLEGTGVLGAAEAVAADTKTNPATKLTAEIKDFNENPNSRPSPSERKYLQELVAEFRRYAMNNMDAWGSLVEGNTPIYQYIKGNDVNLDRSTGTIVPNPNATDPRTQARKTEGGSTEVGKVLTGGFAPRTGAVKGGYQGRHSRVDYNDITDAVDANGKPIAGPMPRGKQKMVIKSFLKRLRNAPRVYDFKDQADLRQRNPDLYRRAAAARGAGDFDTAMAAGYSFGDGEVIIFTDRIANEQHLKFVLAHETFGHYGLRGVLPAAQFDSLMEGLYNDTPSMQMSVDAAMAANPDLGKAEAVEEYLSDYAADLDVSIVRRVWNAIKGVLNKLGLSFGDDSVRYVLDQARRYARSPRQGFPVDLNKIAQRVHAVETGLASTGRYKTATDYVRDMRTQDAVARMGLSLPKDFQEGLDAMAGKWKNFDDMWRGFKSTFLSLSGFDSRTNPGLKRLYDILQRAGNIAMSVKNQLNETMRPALDRAFFGFGGMTAAEYGQANELLHHARIRAIMELRENPQDKRAPLLAYNKATGKFERTAEVERLDNLYRLKLEDARDGFDYTFTNLDDDGNVIGEPEVIRVPGIPGLTEDSKVWRAYEAARKAYIDTELLLLEAHLSAGMIREDTALKEIGSVVPDGELTTAERALMRMAIARYQELYNEGSSVSTDGAITYVDASIQTAKEFAKAFNMAVIANESADADTEAQARNNAVKQFFDQDVADDIVAQIEAFKKRAAFTTDRYIVQNKIIALHTEAVQQGSAGDFASNSIVTQYSPIVRTGDYETRLVPKDAKTGRIVSLDGGYKDALLYSQFGSRDEALQFAKTLREAFKDTPYTVRARGADGEMVEMDVVFEPVVDRVLVEAANPLGVNLNEFIAGLNYFDINLPPAKREEIVTAMTAQDAAARRRLRAGLNPGDARDAIAGIAKHIDGRASTIAKVYTRPLIDELMNPRIRGSNELWSGDGARVERLRTAYEAALADPGANDKVKAIAKREYDEALMMYRNTNPAAGESRRNEARNKAARTLAFLDQNASVNESDFEGAGMIAAWRSYTSLVQLGGSLATGLLNPVSVYTNGVPYLASYNEKTAFGGGFGAGAAVTAVNTAFAQVGIPGMKNLQGMNTAEFWDSVVLDEALQTKYRVTKREAQMIAREIREGRMIPAQSNALVGTSRGRTTRGSLSKAIDLWMSPFNLTEQASRRAFGLAAFRLEYARQRQGIDPTLDPNSAEFKAAEQVAYERAVDFAGRAMDLALGDYSVLNRPAFFRSGLPSMLYMYKVFPTTSIQMFRNLSYNGKMGMLAALWLLGGVAALPFAEDFEDLFDTLLQVAGVGEGSVRAWAAKRLDEVSPGLTPLILKGALGNYLPGDVSGRVALSVIPGTDALLAGSDSGRVFEEILGPMPSALLGTAQFAADLVRAPFSETVTMEKVLREAPVTGLRMAADAYAYTQSGAIIDRRGYIVAPNVTAGEIAMRLAGFYPRRAAESFGNVRVVNRIADYRREVAASYRQEWVTARIRNDRTRMREIEQAVREWNNYHRGSPLAISNFRESANRAYREAVRPATERSLRAVPQAGRSQLESIVDALTY